MGHNAVINADSCHSLVALMLGRLRMSIRDCIIKFTTLVYSMYRKTGPLRVLKSKERLNRMLAKRFDERPFGSEPRRRAHPQTGHTPRPDNPKIYTRSGRFSTEP